MSESVSTGGATTSAAPASASPATSGVTSSPATAGAGSSPQGGAGVPTGGNPATPAATTRELGETDFDALVPVKVNGQDKKVPLREAIKNFQLEQAAQERMRQVAEERKRLQSDWQRQQAELKDPQKWAKMAGVNLEELAETLLAKKYDLMHMDPNQRQALEYKEKLDAYEAKENQSKQGLLDQIKEVVGSLPDGADQATKEQLQIYLGHQKQIYQQETAKYQKEVAEAWLETGLPKYSSVGKDIAFQMLKAQKSGTPLQPREAAAIVKAERLSSAREIMSQMDAKAIQDFLGTELVQKLRDYDVDRVNQNKGPQFGNPQNGPGQTPASNAPKKTLNQIEWRKAMGLD